MRARTFYILMMYACVFCILRICVSHLEAYMQRMFLNLEICAHMFFTYEACFYVCISYFEA
jgi:hypothetical protein